MKKKVLVCDEISESGVRALRDAGLDVQLKLDLSKEQLIEELSKCDAVIVRSRTKLTKDMIQAGKSLKAIGRAGVGLDTIDVEAAKSLGIKVLDAAQASTASVAELAIGLMLALARNIPKGDSSMKEGKWLKSQLSGSLLQGKTLGIIGFGRIGVHIARIARSMGMNILVSDPKLNSKCLEEVCAKSLPLEDLLKESDVVTLNVALTADTKGLMNETNLRKMKRGAILINTSRGKIVDEKALLKALKEGWIAGAGLDVFESEPPTDWELMKIPNVVCTPHIGAQTKEAQELVSTIIAQRVIETLRD